MIDVSIVVPTWKRPYWLDRCLRAIAQQEPKPSAVMVVGRDSDVDAHLVTSSWVDRVTFSIRWVPVTESGHVAPVLAGLKEAEARIVAYLDDDSEPQADWLASLLEPFGDPTVGCVGGPAITAAFKGKVHPDAGRIRWYGKHVGNVGHLQTPHPVEVEGVMECNWAWRRELLVSLEIDPIFHDDDASMYGLDLCLQANAAGYRVVYQPRAKVIHHVAPRDPSLDRGDRAHRTFTYSRNYTYIALKHLRGLRRAGFLGWWWLVGERGSYGIGTAAFDLLGRRDGTGRRLRASLAGKRAGYRAWRSR